jgi:hypothetical protein
MMTIACARLSSGKRVHANSSALDELDPVAVREARASKFTPAQ